jgi:hypothetical protein
MNILVVGDSLSSIGQCGLGDQLHHHYVRQIESKNHNVTNLSVGGQSNQNILLKTCLELSKQKNHYELVIIQWSSLFRINFNKGDSIYEGYTYFNVWSQDNEKQFKSFWATWSKHFIHPRMEILEWCSQIILLENLLKQQAIPYVFVRGFDNFFNDLTKKDWKIASDEFKSIVIQLDRHPDWEIKQVYDELVSMYNCTIHDNWLNLYTDSWYDSRVDLAADNSHPGPLSHVNYYNSLENYIKKLGLSF